MLTSKYLESAVGINRFSNKIFSIFGYLVMGVGMIVYIRGGSIPALLSGNFLVGIGNSFQRVGTRSILRRNSGSGQYSDMLGMEMLISKPIDMTVSYLFLALSAHGLSEKNGILISFFCILLTLPIFLSLESQEQEKTAKL